MNETPLDTLLALVAFDQQFLALVKHEAELVALIQHNEREIKVCEDGIKKIADHKKEMQLEVAKKELEMKRLDELEKDIKKRLDSAQNQREYQSATSEIEKVKGMQHGLEEDLIATWKKLEHAEQEYRDRAAFCEKKIAEHNVAIQETMQKIQEAKQQIEQLKEQRQEKLATVPKELAEKYEAMYQHVSNPIVSVQKGSCSGCFYTITQQDMLYLRTGKLIQCKECFRFLYLS